MDNWKHRSEGMKCPTCMHFVPKQKKLRDIQETREIKIMESDPIYHVGRCRRHAPTMNGYPVVFVSDWCGDHKIDEEKI